LSDFPLLLSFSFILLDFATEGLPGISLCGLVSAIVGVIVGTIEAAIVFCSISKILIVINR
jgi:hypothetical protein